MTTAHKAVDIEGFLPKKKLPGGPKDGTPVKLLTKIVASAGATNPQEAMRVVMRDEIIKHCVEFNGQAEKWAKIMRALVHPTAHEGDDVLWSKGENRENTNRSYVLAVREGTGFEVGSRGTMYLLKAVGVAKAVEEWCAKTIGEVEDVIEGWDFPLSVCEAAEHAAHDRITAVAKDMIDGIKDALRDKTMNVNSDGEPSGDNNHSSGMRMIFDKYNLDNSTGFYRAVIEYETIGRWIWELAFFAGLVITDKDGWAIKDKLETKQNDPHTYGFCRKILDLFAQDNIPDRFKDLKVSKNIFNAAQKCVWDTYEVHHGEEAQYNEDQQRTKRARLEHSQPVQAFLPDSDGY